MKNRKLRWFIFWGCFLLFLFPSVNLFAVEESGGVGMKLSQLFDYTTQEEDKRGSLVVIDVFKGGPAFKNGIEKGDIILKVDDVITKQHDFKELLHNHLRGPAFTGVRLIIWRCSIMEKIEVEMQRIPMVY